MKITIDIPDEVVESGAYCEYYGAWSKMLQEAFENGERRKTGKWFDNVDMYDKRANKHDYLCLECKTHAMDFVCGSEDWWCCKPPKYCPNCVAKMEVDE